MTRILPADAAAILEAAALIRSGELVAFPTETVYGLGANAFDAAAVARIFAAKGRPATDPLIVHVADTDQLAEVTDPALLSKLAQRLIESFWPGPLTLIMPRAERIPPTVSAGLPTIGVRLPSHSIAQTLIRAAGVPIAAPSANRFAHTSPTTAQHVYEDLAGRIPLILDGGASLIGVESAIVDVSGAIPLLLRPGGVSFEALVRVAPTLEIRQRTADPTDGAALPAPGLLLKHYAPRAPLTLFEGRDATVRTALHAEALRLQQPGQRVGLLIADEDQAALADLQNAGAVCVTLGSIDDLEQIAHRLFAGLRALDAQGVDVILARTFPPQGIGLALRDRLMRAAEGKLVLVDVGSC